MKFNRPILYFFIILFLAMYCKKEKEQTDSQLKGKPQKMEVKEEEKNIKQEKNERFIGKSKLKIKYSEDKSALKSYYDLPHIKEFYKWQNMEYSPYKSIDSPNDLSSLEYDELRLLRNEIFARNGYLFNDAFLRGHFNQFKWYMPIFDVDSFKVILNKDEKALINKILIEESYRRKNKTVSIGNLQLFNTDLIVNKKHFFTAIPEKMNKDFKKQNFSIIDANRAMPFYIYDKNAYQYIPHYITTDFYLFIMHKYFSRFLEKLDENFMYKQLYNLLKNTRSKIHELLINEKNASIKTSIDWAHMYTSLALYAIGDSLVRPSDNYLSIFNQEKQNIDSLSGNPIFIKNQFVNYGELKPRGHYTKSKKLKKYFSGFKWISLNGIDIENRRELIGYSVFAHIIKNDQKLYDNLKRFISIMEKIAGQEDNLSIIDVVKLSSAKNLQDAVSDESIALLKTKLQSLNKEKIEKVFGKSFNSTEKESKRIYFLSSTYSISGDIFSKLVHVNFKKSKRPFPKGLDIPAVFGNQSAKEIIINEYKDHEKWSEYLPKLNALKQKFKNFKNWDHNYGFKGVQTALASFAEMETYPDFMKTMAYNKKELSTALASWTHIKHDLILYQEKPYAAEAGQGGGPEPPLHYSYVEPNIVFWDKALGLVEWLEKLTKFESTFSYELRGIRKLGVELRDIAYKEIRGIEITNEDYKNLHYVGGTVEHILLSLLETDHLPERERSMALIADVYAYNGSNLNVAVGHADDIYTVVPIKGDYYIARGSVFSYYEFTGDLYNDEEWREKVKNGNIPERPKWLNSLINDEKPLTGKMQYRY